MPNLLDTLLTEARGWLADCGSSVPEWDRSVALKVDRNYDGGWPEFVRADPDADEAAVYAEVKDRWGTVALELLYPAPDPTPTGDPLPIRG
jgi:hypothetical protein